jgi:hypothetical protein
MIDLIVLKGTTSASISGQSQAPVFPAQGRINSTVTNVTPGIDRSIQATRIQQQRQQVATVTTAISVSANRLPVATYAGRDPVRGDRLMVRPDGGKARVKWIATTAPQATPPLVNLISEIGLKGYAGQK